MVLIIKNKKLWDIVNGNGTQNVFEYQFPVPAKYSVEVTIILSIPYISTD
jgi:hypothetical protein